VCGLAIRRLGLGGGKAAGLRWVTERLSGRVIVPGRATPEMSFKQEISNL
jgi:hypothetical protein